MNIFRLLISLAIFYSQYVNVVGSKILMIKIIKLMELLGNGV